MAFHISRPAVTIMLLALAAVAPIASHAQAGATVVEYNYRNDSLGAPGGRFFYSSDPAEQLNVDIGGVGPFYRTGRTFAAGGATPVCRFYGSVTPGPNSHFFTVDPAECAGLKAAQLVPAPSTIPQWNFERNDFTTTLVTQTPSDPGDQATAARTCPAGTTMVYRAYNNAFAPTGARNPWNSNHRLVRSQSDITSMVGLGWKDEGGVFCAPNSSMGNVFQKTSVLAGRCVAPRSDPKYGDRPGTLTAENAWVRSYVDETYLWYDEVPELSPASYAGAKQLFSALKTPALSASGRRLKDRFHFYYDTPQWEALNKGKTFGYGFELAAESSTPPRVFYVAYSEPNSPAGQAGIGRGAKILEVDGADLINGNDLARLNGGLFPSTIGETHTFKILDLDATTPRTVTLVSADVAMAPVNTVATIPTGSGNVGYILFNDHNFPAEGQLISAVRQLKNEGINDLVLDLRYNGGGFLYIASQLAYMIAGPTETNNKIFERLTFSDKRSAETKDPDNSYPFFDTASGYPGTDTVLDAQLPFLNLKRVFVLTSGGTASASEAVINGLEGINLQVIRIGTTTYGKPYGFSPQDNCNVTYMSVEFKGANHKGFADYDDGFAPTCTVPDDFTHVLGDQDEKRLAAALTYRATGACPPVSSSAAVKALAVEPQLFRTPARESRILLKGIGGTSLKRR